MLTGLSRQCAIGVKKSGDGVEYWRGFKLHTDVADGQIPISAILTGANVSDVNVAIPLMTITAERVTSLYDLMDSAYDADAILAHSREMGHIPIVKPHPRRNGRSKSILPKVFSPKKAPELTWAQQARFRERTTVERVYARLKEEFGGRHVRVRGAAKVMAHLMFGILALTVDQVLKLTG
jgi:IS5 family transposase